MRFFALIKIPVHIQGQFHRRMCHAGPCFDVWSDALFSVLFIEKLIIKNKAKTSFRLAWALSAMFAVMSTLGCGFRKVTREQQAAVLRESTTDEADFLTIAKTQQVEHFRAARKDSVATSVTIEIWPKGTFSINREQGFVGAAEKIRIQGHQQALLRAMLQTDVQESSGSIASDRKSQRQQRSFSKKETLVQKNPAWKWALAMLALAIGCYMAVYLLRRDAFPG